MSAAKVYPRYTEAKEEDLVVIGKYRQIDREIRLPGLNYEPWHWRYVGTVEAKRLLRL